MRKRRKIEFKRLQKQILADIITVKRFTVFFKKTWGKNENNGKTGSERNKSLKKRFFRRKALIYGRSGRES